MNGRVVKRTGLYDTNQMQKAFKFKVKCLNYGLSIFHSTVILPSALKLSNKNQNPIRKNNTISNFQRMHKMLPACHQQSLVPGEKGNHQRTQKYTPHRLQNQNKQ